MDTPVNGRKAEFLPFNALNAFMRPDFQADVLKQVFEQLDHLPAPLRKELDLVFRKRVSIPGFRNSSTAPASLRARHSSRAFEKYPDFTAAAVQAWSSLHPQLRVNVHQLLEQLGWTILPLEADLARLPGFIPTWPAGQDFNSIHHRYLELFPGDGSREDDISLMAVWLSGRIPANNNLENQETHTEE